MSTTLYTANDLVRVLACSLKTAQRVMLRLERFGLARRVASKRGKPALVVSRADYERWAGIEPDVLFLATG